MQAERPAEAFAAAADMYRSRAGVDAGLWEAILPPVILVFVAVGIGFLILAMFLPLIKLISCLT
jgi:type II secretory pathway component PulF